MMPFSLPSLPRIIRNSTRAPALIDCLVLGSGGREQALCDLLGTSPSCGRLYALPGSAGISEMTGAHCPELSHSMSSEEVIIFCERHDIDLVVVGPEGPLVSGIEDALTARGISVFAPSKAASRIEGSKIWMKEILSQAGISTPRTRVALSLKEANRIVSSCSDFPLVIKADGLASGKGVVIASTRKQAERAVERAMVEKCFGSSGERLLFEDFIVGEELSYFSLCDGSGEDGSRFLGVARDYKRACDGDKGLNTGGMGAFAFSPPYGDSGCLEERGLRDSIVRPLLRALEKNGVSYRGFLFLGLLVDKSGVKVLEINARFGDPEAQTLLPLLEGDLAATFLAAARGKLSESESRLGISRLDGRLFDFTEGMHSVSVVATSKGYPELPSAKLGEGISLAGLNRFETSADVSLFHSNTLLHSDAKDRFFCANGGRVFTINARGGSFAEARSRAYDLLGKIDWREGFYRSDIANERDTRAFTSSCAKVLSFS